MAGFQCWRSKIQGEMLPNFFKVLSEHLGTAKDPDGTPRITEAAELSTPAELGAALVGKVYSEESFKGENISHLSCAFKRKVA
jgi:hypothetical protein